MKSSDCWNLDWNFRNVHRFLIQAPCRWIAVLLLDRGCKGILKLSRLEWSVAKRVEGLALFLEEHGMNDRAELMKNHAIQEDAHARLLESWLESQNFPVERMRREGGLLFARSDKLGYRGYQYPVSIHTHPLVRLFLFHRPLGQRDYKEQIIAYGYLEQVASQMYEGMKELLENRLGNDRLCRVICKIAKDELAHSDYLHSIKWDRIVWGKREWSLTIWWYHIYWFILSVVGIFGVAIFEYAKSVKDGRNGTFFVKIKIMLL